MNVTGRLIEVVEEFEGSSVKGDVAAGATTFPLADLGDFAEDGLCMVLDAPYAYTVDEAAGAIAIDPPLAADAGDGTPVYALTWDSRQQSQVIAVVDLLDDDDEPGIARADVPVNLRPMYPTGQSLAGALVDLTATDSGYVVANSPMRGLGIDGSFTYNPHALCNLGNPFTLPTDTWTTVKGWVAYGLQNLTYDPATGEFTFNTDGDYQIHVGITFDDDATAPDVGARAVRLHFETAAGPEVSRMVKHGAVGTTAFETNQERPFAAGDRVKVQAWQNCGQDLDLLGVAGMAADTTLSIRRRT